MIERMAKVEILGLKDVSLDAIDIIQDQGTLHIEDLSEKMGELGHKRMTPMELDPNSAEHETRLGELRGKVGDMIRELQPETEEICVEDVQEAYGNIWSENADVLISRIERFLRDVERDTSEVVEKRSDLTLELARLEKYIPIMQKIQPLAERVAGSSDMASIALIIERRYKAILNYLNEEIGKLTGGESEVVASDVDDESTAALIVFNRRYLKQVHDFLAVQDVNQVRLPSDLARKPIDEAVAEVRVRMAELPVEIEALDAQLESAKEKYSVKLIAARNAILDRIEAIEVMPKFGQTEQVFFISGWLPEDKVEDMEEALSGKLGNKVNVAVVDIRDEEELEETPVTLSNKPFVRYFEAIYLLSKYPKYGTIDPTIIFAIFFPFFVGLMVGDIGYGICMMIIGWVVHRKLSEKPFFNMIGYMLTVAGAWTVVFGILYLEFFGDLIEVVLHHYHVSMPLLGHEGATWVFPIIRIEAFEFMLLLCCGLGFLHIAIGLVIGVINGFREHDRRHIMEKAGTLMVLTGFVLAIAKVIFSWWPMPVAVFGGVMLLVGIVLAAKGAGMGGLIESIVGAGNILSYSRLIAIGLASVIMAQVANDISRELWGGVFGIIMGVLLAVLLHSLNIVIASFSPSIHSLRLHLVECFGKFFEPAKYKYEPFKKTTGGEQ
jgi:V/A-type H+/Na+-transporting ATPase subunit I